MQNLSELPQEYEELTESDSDEPRVSAGTKQCWLCGQLSCACEAAPTVSTGQGSASGGATPSSPEQSNARQVYGQIIDSYRLRVEDEYTQTGDVDMDCLYGGEPMPIRHFKRYVRKALRKGVLAAWWGPDPTKGLCEMGMTDDWHCIAYACEKSDVVEYYSKRGLPMEHVALRSLANRIAGPIHGGFGGFGFNEDSEDECIDDSDFDSSEYSDY
eukprot:TRINITY_DN10941_c0_g1_i1.p1 TRINITY_DN10941_c0_g1~~TRINITY_DN10941_c0_g1_i1.p1  ORF type:complete len:214 (-),score=13.80 TRINITY_DN10941_c0_g1_i1:37-678(-)